MSELQIIRADDRIDVQTIVGLISGDPGIGKSTLAFDAKAPVMLDFDHRLHAVKNRKDALRITAWGQVHSIFSTYRHVIDDAETIIFDTIGRALDMLTLHLIDSNKAYSNGAGSLSEMGWGKLKYEFGTKLIAPLRAMGKDILFLSHTKREKRKGKDEPVFRPDIQGGTLDEVFKTCDFVGYLYRNDAGERELSFDDVGGRIAKNSAKIPPQIIPDLDVESGFLSALIDTMKSQLGSVAEAQREAFKVIEEYRPKIATLQYEDEFDVLLEDVNAIPHEWAMKQIKLLMRNRGNEIGVTYDPEKKRFTGKPRPQQEEPTGKTEPDIITRINKAQAASYLNGLHFEADMITDPALKQAAKNALMARAVAIGVRWNEEKQSFYKKEK